MLEKVLPQSLCEPRLPHRGRKCPLPIAASSFLELSNGLCNSAVNITWCYTSVYHQIPLQSLHDARSCKVTVILPLPPWKSHFRRWQKHQLSQVQQCLRIALKSEWTLVQAAEFSFSPPSSKKNGFGSEMQTAIRDLCAVDMHWAFPQLHVHEWCHPFDSIYIYSIHLLWQSFSEEESVTLTLECSCSLKWKVLKTWQYLMSASVHFHAILNFFCLLNNMIQFGQILGITITDVSKNSKDYIG